MSINPIRFDALTVSPVVDYEPPARAVSRCRPPAVSTRPRHPRPDRSPPAAPSQLHRAAAVFADAALRRVLEVIDRRRPASQLYPLLAAGLADSVRSAHPAGAPGRTGTAVLQRVRVQLIGPGDPPTIAEAFGTYRRGRRIHALACRIERAPAGTGPGWRVVALHIG